MAYQVLFIRYHVNAYPKQDQGHRLASLSLESSQQVEAQGVRDCQQFRWKLLASPPASQDSEQQPGHISNRDTAIAAVASFMALVHENKGSRAEQASALKISPHCTALSVFQILYLTCQHMQALNGRG